MFCIESTKGIIGDEGKRNNPKSEAPWLGRLANLSIYDCAILLFADFAVKQWRCWMDKRVVTGWGESNESYASFNRDGYA